jgi:hypothetical protein
MELHKTAAVVLCLLTAGCLGRQRESYIIDVFATETRLLEDQIYELNDRVADLEARLETGRPSTRRSADPDEDETFGEERSTNGRDDESLPDLTPPEVEPGSPTHPGDLPTPGDDLPDDEDQDENENVLEPTDRHVEHIELGSATQAADFDGSAGDDGVRVVVEPRNRAGELLSEEGDISVVLVDAAATPPARVATWEFDAAAAAAAWKSNAAARGIVLEARWPKPPQNADLMLFVRYHTADGRKLEAQKPLQAQLAEHVAQRWTPRPAAVSPPPGRRSVTSPPADQGPPADVYR